jgi:hypothetical protein
VLSNELQMWTFSLVQKMTYILASILHDILYSLNLAIVHRPVKEQAVPLTCSKMNAQFPEQERTSGPSRDSPERLISSNEENVSWPTSRDYGGAVWKDGVLQGCFLH